MLNAIELSNLRFAMSKPPEQGGRPGDYEEKLSQWFLERSFFRDFTYRNPRGKKKSEELADAVVLFDDVGLLVQVKAKYGQSEAHVWAEEALRKALLQLKATYKNLTSGAIKKLKNDLYGEQPFDPNAYPNLFGIIILAHASEPYDPRTLVPELDQTGFPVHVVSLADLALLTYRFDTAADFINLIELRTDVGKHVRFLVNDEPQNLLRLKPYVKETFRQQVPSITNEALDRSVASFERRASGAQSASSDWRFSFPIDDMIARAHDQDPDLSWNGQGTIASLEVARYLGWLPRDRRMSLGKRILDMCKSVALDGELTYSWHVQRARGTVGVYLVSNLARSERVKYLQFLLAYAHYKWGSHQCFGVATEPLGPGRSYDFIVAGMRLSEQMIEHFKAIDDPFASGEGPDL